jgi:YidC/Oxa1 family membrane protein insertase
MLLIVGLVLAFFQFGMPMITGKNDKPQALPEEVYKNAPAFEADAVDPPASPDKPNAPAEGELCKLSGSRFDATLSTRGAALTSFVLKDKQYADRGGMEMVTTPDHERWRPLRTLFRSPEANDQVAYDRFPWKLEKQDGTSCVFSFEDPDVKIVKTIRANARAFELEVETTITNLASVAKKHQLQIGEYSYRKNADVKGSMGRVSPFQTELACASGKDVERKAKDDFKSGWFGVPAADRYAAVNSHFFAQALVPMEGGTPSCEVLAQNVLTPGATDSDEHGAVYQAKLVYPVRELAPMQVATYRQISFNGPKERDVLAKAAGGDKLRDVINLGFFSPVARFLVGVLRFLHDQVTGNWGLAVILMTIGLRTLLFPLTWKSIKTTINMRKLKPEVDALNAKFADDAQAKNLAMMELWKKHGVNPFGGCLPQLVQMPVWFAMYTTLQTAVEMYHTKFLWFSDLSAPDKYFVLPLLLGVFMIVQQRIVPQQGMDPVQQKMMMYMLPAVFTFMMLFLPAALGVYMLTNSILGIAQQLIVEQVAPRNDKREIVVKQAGGSDKNFGKGKARV